MKEDENVCLSLTLIETLNISINRFAEMGIDIEFWLPGDIINLRGDNYPAILSELKRKIVLALERIKNGYLNNHPNAINSTVKLFDLGENENLLEIAEIIGALSKVVIWNDKILTELGISRTSISTNFEDKLNLYCSRILKGYFSDLLKLMQNLMDVQETGVNVCSDFILIYTKYYHNKENGYSHVNIQNALMEIQENEETHLKRSKN